MQAYVLNITPGENHSVLIECQEKETRTSKVIRVEEIVNEVTAVPFTYSADSIERLENEVREKYGEYLVPFDNSELFRWEERTICREKNNPELSGMKEKRLVFHIVYSKGASVRMDTAKRISKEFTSPVEAFILIKKIKGPTLVELKKISNGSAKMSNIQLVEYSMPSINIAYIYSERRSMFETVSISVYNSKEYAMQNIHNDGVSVRKKQKTHFSSEGSRFTRIRQSENTVGYCTFTTQNITDSLEDAVSSNISHCDSPDTVISRVHAYIKEIDADMVVGYNIPSEIFKRKTKEAKSALVHTSIKENAYESERSVSLFCDLPKYIESVNRLNEYTIEEMCKTYLIPDEIDEIEEPEHRKNTPHLISDSYDCVINRARACTVKMHRVFKEGQLLSLAEKLARITGAPLNSIFNGYKSDRVEYLLLHQMREHKYAIPKQLIDTRVNSKDTYEGGYVFLERPGVYSGSYIALFDFNSLYPSIIQEYNVCFSTADVLTINTAPEERRPSLLPGILKDLVDQRSAIKKKMQNSQENTNVLEVEQRAVKLVANCIYGCLGYKGFRFYNKKMAAFITECGRSILKDTKYILEQKGYRVIYGDTDSVMVDTKIKVTEPAPSDKLLMEIAECISGKYAGIRLGFEKMFTKLVILAKKKYFGICVGDGKSYIEEKGLETGRRDWADVARNTTEETIKILLYAISPEEEVLKMLLKFKENINSLGKEHFVIRKKIQKNPESYAQIQSTSLHQVALALRLKHEKGIVFHGGDILSYVMALHNGVSRPELVTEAGEISYDYYIKMQVFPPIQRMLEFFPEISIENIQKVLGIYKPAYKPPVYTQAHSSSIEVLDGLDITTPCCNVKQEIARVCSSCSAQFSSRQLKHLIRKIIYKQSISLYAIQRQCIRCEIKDEFSPACYKCHLPTEWVFPPLEHFHKVLYRLQSIFSGTEEEKYAVNLLSISDYLVIDITQFPLNEISEKLYIPSMIGRRDILDALFR